MYEKLKEPLETEEEKIYVEKRKIKTMKNKSNKTQNQNTGLQHLWSQLVQTARKSRKREELRKIWKNGILRKMLPINTDNKPQRR